MLLKFYLILLLLAILSVYLGFVRFPMRNWLIVPQWVKFTVATMMFRYLLYSAPWYNRHASRHRHRSQSTTVCQTTSIVVILRYNRSTCRRASSVADPATWNSLTDSPHDPSLSADSFCRQLRTFLFSNLTVCIQRIRAILPMHYINRRFTYLVLTYLLMFILSIGNSSVYGL